MKYLNDLGWLSSLYNIIYNYIYSLYFDFSTKENYFSPVLGIFFPISFKIKRKLSPINYLFYIYSLVFLFLFGFIVNEVTYSLYKINIFGIYLLLSIQNLFIRYTSYRNNPKHLDFFSYLCLGSAYIFFHAVSVSSISSIIFFILILMPFVINLFKKNKDYTNWIKFKNLEFNFKLFPFFLIIFFIASYSHNLLVNNELDWSGGNITQKFLGFDINSVSINVGNNYINFNLIYFLNNVLFPILVLILVVYIITFFFRINAEDKFYFTSYYPKYVLNYCKLVYNEEIYIGKYPILQESKNISNFLSNLNPTELKEFKRGLKLMESERRLKIKELKNDSLNQVYYCNDDYLEELRELLTYVLKNMIHISINKEMISKSKNESIHFGKNELNKYDLIDYVIKMVDGILLYGNTGLKKKLFKLLDETFDNIGNGKPIYMTNFMSELEELYLNKKLNYFRNLKENIFRKRIPSLSNLIIWLIQTIVNIIIYLKWGILFF